MTTTTGDPDLDRVKKIATVALHRAIAGDMEDAAQYMGRLNGSDGLIRAVMMFADTYLAAIAPDHQPGQLIQIRWLHTPTDQVETADEVAPSMRWAGRIISARASNDEAGFIALLRAPAEGLELGNAIMALVHIVAESVTNIDRVRAAGEAMSTKPAEGTTP